MKYIKITIAIEDSSMVHDLEDEKIENAFRNLLEKSGESNIQLEIMSEEDFNYLKRCIWGI